MQVFGDVLMVASSLGAVQSGFISIYLLTVRKGLDLSGRLLGLLLLCLAVRMAKSVGYYFSGGDLPDLIENIGYAASIAIGPLLLVYVRSLLSKDFRFREQFLVHFVPAAVVLFASPLLAESFWLGASGGYFWSLFYVGIYFLFVYSLLLKAFFNEDIRRAGKWNWAFIISVGVTVVWAAYVANYVFGLVPYITAPTIFSFVIYIGSFVALRHHEGVFAANLSAGKYKNSALSREEMALYAERIKRVMEVEGAYLDPHLTLNKLAKQISVSGHRASEVINRYFQMSFADLVASYRLKKAKVALEDPQKRNQKISSIAFDCGFGTLSAFNTTFKKHTQMTPSEYRHRFQNSIDPHREMMDL